MDDKKLAKLIDEIVKLRLEKILKSDSFKNLIREQAQKQVIKILLEAKGNIVPQKSSPTSLKRTAASVLGEDNNKKERIYPTLPKKQTKTFSKNPMINAILSQTADNISDMSSYDNQSALLEMVDARTPVKIGANFSGINSRTSINPGNLANEAMSMAQAELAKHGFSAAYVEENTDINSTPTNNNFKDMFNEQYIEYNDDITGVDDSMLVEANDAMAHVAKALTRDYTQLLKRTDEKAKEKRPLL